MARNTEYILFNTGRIDPTLSNIWAFRSPAERDNWLGRHFGMRFTNNKYWRVGNTIKIPVSYESSFVYDYIRITNDAGTPNARVWYAFITARAYVSPSVTLLTLDVDYIQTYYFTGNVPFWDTSGFIVKTTAHIAPLPGSPVDYPVPETETETFAYESGSYAFILYSTIDPATVSTTPTYQGAMISGVYTAACPYVVGGSAPGTALNNIVSAFNTAGYTDAISAIYAVPARFINASYLDGQAHSFAADTVVDNTMRFVYTPDNVEYADVIHYYGYDKLTINNGQGETDEYSFYEFTGDPVFTLTLSVSGGCPTLYCIPTNLKFHTADQAQQRSMKITQAISCVFLNDSYKIWLAQTQNSRAAALEGARLGINQAEEARSKSWAYQFGGIVERAEEHARDPLTGALADIIGSTGEMFGADMGNTGISSVGRKFGASDTGIAALDAPVQTYGSRYRELQRGLGTMYDLGTRYINHQLGIETRYTYDHAVANAQQRLNELAAGWADKARIPATARGSAAYGDMAYLRQYGFMFTVTTPAPAVKTVINSLIAASGYTVNQYGMIYDEHDTFDFYQVNSAKIAVNTSARPEFVRKMMVDLLGRGVYLWYIKSGDISEYFASPYGVENEVIGNG